MNHPFKQGDKLCNAFSVGGWDCVEIDEGKRLKVSIIQGHPKIYVLQPKVVVVDETRSSLFAIGLIVATVIFLVYLILSSRHNSVTTTTDYIASKSD